MKTAEDKRKDLWQSIRQEVQESSDKEPVLARFLDSAVLCHGSLAEVLAFRLADKLASSMMDAPALYEIFLSILCADKGMMHSVEEDILAYYQRDPACQRYCLPLLYYKGFHAIQIHRINHALCKISRRCWLSFSKIEPHKFLVWIFIRQCVWGVVLCAIMARAW